MHEPARIKSAILAASASLSTERRAVWRCLAARSTAPRGSDTPGTPTASPVRKRAALARLLQDIEVKDALLELLDLLILQRVLVLGRAQHTLRAGLRGGDARP